MIMNKEIMRRFAIYCLLDLRKPSMVCALRTSLRLFKFVPDKFVRLRGNDGVGDCRNDECTLSSFRKVRSAYPESRKDYGREATPTFVSLRGVYN